MGTRNLSICKKDGELKVVNYGQWDGYPDGQGRTVHEFCSKERNLKQLKAIVDRIHSIEELPEFCKEYDELCPQYLNSEDKRSPAMVYWFEKFISRDNGAKIFKNLVDYSMEKLPKEMNGLPYLRKYNLSETSENYSDIWIEYAYVIDFDENKLKCYGHDKLLGIFDLYDLPDEDEFVRLLEKTEASFYPEEEE